MRRRFGRWCAGLVLVVACGPSARPASSSRASLAADEHERCRARGCDDIDDPLPVDPVEPAPPIPAPPTPAPPALPPIPPAASQGWVARSGQNLELFARDKGQLIRAGFRVTSVAGYELGGEQRVDAIWVKETTPGPPWEVVVGLSAVEHDAMWRQRTATGWRTNMIHAHAGPSGPRFAAVYDRPLRAPEQLARHGMDATTYQREVDRQARRGMRLVTVSGYLEAGEVRYAASWERRAAAQQARHGLTASQLRAEVDRLTASGWRPTWVSAYATGPEQRFAVIWEKQRRPSIVRAEMTADQYAAELEEHRFGGLRPIATAVAVVDGTERRTTVWHVSGFDDDDLDKVARHVEAFRRRHKIPGISIAIAKDERLVFARGYGLADQDANVPVSIQHRFRIASVSKSITAVAILTLVQSGALSLDDKVFGPTGILRDAPIQGRPDRDKLHAITIRHLLQHTSGGWPNASNDPLGRELHLDVASLIAWVLQNHAEFPIRHAPGDHYAYSNFGYVLLGRVIETVKPGTTYEDHVRAAVLAPVGADAMVIGADGRAGRRPDEVAYYGTLRRDDPYDIPMRRHAANGGWVARPIELLRFAVRVDGSARKPDILNASMLEAMLTGSSDKPTYGLGWRVKVKPRLMSRPGVTVSYEKVISHGGKLAGVRAFLAESANGVWIAILANTDGGFDDGPDESPTAIKGGHLVDLAYDLEHAIGPWPAYDLF